MGDASSTDRALRVAVVGPGGWGRQHVRIFRDRPDTELVAVVGRDRGRTDSAATWARTAGFTDLDRMLVETRPDLVTIALPTESHFEVTWKALGAGVSVLVEKPLVFTLAEADQLLA